MFRVSTESIHFSGGDVIDIARNGIVVLTGPNNVGKSSTLEAIHRRLDLRHGLNSANSSAVSSVSLRIDGTEDEYIQFLMDKYKYDKDEETIVFDSGYSRDLKVSTHRQRFSAGIIPNQVLDDLTLRLTARERLENSRNEGIEAAANTLFSDELTEVKISEIFKRSFFRDLVLDRTRQGGNFKIAERSKLPKRSKLFSPESRKLYDSLPSVARQGDGLRSFTRILLEIMVGEWHVIIVDEPELFLHPPQIRQLARFIAEDTPPDTQIIIATHSTQFLQNLVDHASERLEVIRITRNDHRNSAKKLSSENIRELWSDPVVAASGVLDALFHDAAILCEGDSDLKFFISMMSATSYIDRSLDVEFFHAGGKDRIIPLVNALKHLGITVCAIVDIDIFSDIDKFRRIFVSFGGDDSALIGDLKILNNFVNNKRTHISGDYFCSQIEGMISEIRGQPSVPKDTAKKIYGLLKSSSPWGAIKDNGIKYFSGEPYNAVKRLYSLANSVGLFIVPEGELEGFCRTASRTNKAAWLADTLRRNLETDPELEGARSFLAQVLTFATSRSR